jgi:hypothetical protein
MLDLGSDDKEKLKENMEEIKELVNSEKQQKENEKGNIPEQTENNSGGLEDLNQPPVQGQDQDLDSQPLEEPQDNSIPGEGQTGEPDNQADELEGFESDQQISQNDQAQQLQNQEIDTGEEKLDQSPDSESPLQDRNSRENIDNTDRSNSRDLDRDDRNDSSGRREERNQESDDQGLDLKSSPDNVKKENLEEKESSSDSDTLFLEVDEFNEIEDMVSELKYLSREMKDLMDNLEGGVEEDRRIESEAQDVLDEFEKRRDVIESAIR